jgi:hypothetical protein
VRKHDGDDQDTSGESDPYGVGPTDGKSQAAMSLEKDPPEFSEAELEEPESPSQEAPLRFSVLDLFIICSFAGVGLATAQWLPRGVYVGVAGIVAFVALVLASIFKPKSHVTQMLLWAGITVYFFASLGMTVARVTSQPEPTPTTAPEEAPRQPPLP